MLVYAIFCRLSDYVYFKRGHMDLKQPKRSPSMIRGVIEFEKRKSAAMARWTSQAGTSPAGSPLIWLLGPYLLL
jgi:hypothetical protein